ncbi:uncharacterized protein [Pyrus communis]|uniref:uncharacterized protein n=1 Tax=Pyrus communis TaxID=23211 RepID=UPI0035BFACAF
MGSTGSDVFTEIGLTNWKKGPKNLQVHEGGVGSLHNKAVQQARDWMTQKQHIETFVIKQTDEARINYRTLLSASLECTRWLLGQCLPFRGHNESLKSSNRGNYLELMQFLSKHNEQVMKVVFVNAPKNLKYTSSNIKKDCVRACAIETVDAITKDMKGEAIEKFLGVQHVSSTTSSSLEEAIKRLFATTDLTLVFVAKENEDVANFFINASSLVNLIGSSCKCRDAFREKQQEQIQKALDFGNLETGKGLNQESSLMRPCDTRWNSHYGTIVSIIVMFEAEVEVVKWIKSDHNQDNLGEATRLFKDIQTFDFAFHLFLMRLILGIINELSQALQKKDQDILNVMALVAVCKQRLQSLRYDDFGDLFPDVEKFCEEHDIIVPNMEDLHFELNDRFNEVNTKLLLCMACLSPMNKFASFDKAKIVRLAQLYPQDFDRMDLMNLPIQLDNYIHDMKMHSEFSSLRGISDLAKELVKTGRCESYMLVYKFLTLVLVLPIATASVERAFSAMKIVKTPLRNKMGD